LKWRQEGKPTAKPDPDNLKSIFTMNCCHIKKIPFLSAYDAENYFQNF